MSKYTRKEIVDGLVEAFPELTRDGGVILVNVIVDGLVKAVERGDKVVLANLFTIDYTVRTRASGNYGQEAPGANPQPTKVAKVRVAEELRRAIRDLPISEEELREWEENKEYNRKRRASFMYERNRDGK